MSRPLLSLVMIVKDEAKSIREVLEAAKPFVDRWTILDTGSTDGTQDIVRAVLDDKQGHLYEEPFLDFANSRNRALQLDQHDAEASMQWEREDAAVFQLMLSGDEYLVDGDKLRARLEHIYNCRHDDPTDPHLFRIKVVVDGEAALFSPRIFRTGSRWRYESKLPLGLHEFPAHPDPSAPVADIIGPSIQHVVADPERRTDNIWQSHIPALRDHLLQEPEDARALYYLAASLESLLAVPGFFSVGERVTYAMEAMSMYLRRDSLPYGTDHERNHVRCRYFACARHTGLWNDAEVFSRVEELAAADPDRPEVALMHYQAAARVTPISPQLYQYAAHAAEVAVRARDIVSHSPSDATCEWKARYAAARIAQKIAQKAPHEDAGDGKTWEEHAEMQIQAFTAAGGPQEMLDVYLAAAAPPADPEPPEAA